MARTTVKVGFFENDGDPIAGQVADLLHLETGALLDQATTDADGIAAFDAGYPGPWKAGLTYNGREYVVTSESAVWQERVALVDLPTALRAMTAGVFYGVLDQMVMTPGTGRAVNVGTGAVLDGLGHPWVHDDAEDLAISANASGNPRIDLIVVRHYVTDAASASGHYRGKRVLAAVAGTPAASPVAPAATNTADVQEVVLGQVTVASGASSFVQGNIATAGGFWVAPAYVDPATIGDGDLALNGALSATGTSTLGNVDVGGTFNAEGAATFDSSLAINHTGAGALFVESSDGVDLLALDTDTRYFKLTNDTNLVLYTDSGLTPTLSIYGDTGVVELGGPGAPNFRSGTIDPNGSVTAPRGSMFVRTTDGSWFRNTDGGTTWATVT